jgi:hypothetical protein
MATWRRKAAAAFPRHSRALGDPEFSIHHLFFELLPDARAAHDAGDDEALSAIYGFAAWAFEQRDLSNAAAVSFYEHLFDGTPVMHWKAVAEHIPSHIARDLVPLWRGRLGDERLQMLRRFLAVQE